MVEKKPPPKPVEESQKTKDLTNKFISDFASTFTSMGTKAKNSNAGQKAMKATGNAYDAGKAQASKWMSDDQKKKVDLLPGFIRRNGLISICIKPDTVPIDPLTKT